MFDVYGYRNETIIYILYRRLFGWNSGNSIAQECVYYTHTHTHTWILNVAIVVLEKSNFVPFERRCSIPFCVFVSACVFARYTDKSDIKTVRGMRTCLFSKGSRPRFVEATPSPTHNSYISPPSQ